MKRIDKFLIRTFDCVVVITDHSDIDYDLIAKYSNVIVDSRNVFKDYSRDKIFRLGKGK